MKKHVIILLTFLLIPLSHCIINILQFSHFQSRLLHGDNINFGLLRHKGESEVQLLGIYGDLFDPAKHNPETEFDLIPVSCIIDSLSLEQQNITWEFNDLLLSALRKTCPDTQTYQAVANELIRNMSFNSELLKYFISTPPEKYNKHDLLRKKNRVYIWDVPREGKFYQKTRILKFASLPIFKPSKSLHGVDLATRRSRLADNLSITIKRLLFTLRASNYEIIKSIAFPALAGTTRRIDSQYYLDYKRSFFTIYETLLDSKIPNYIDRIYFVVYDGLSNTQEKNDSINALYDLYRYKISSSLPKFDDLFGAPLLKATPFIAIFLIIYIITYPNIKRDWLNYSRTKIIIKIFAVITILTAAVPYLVDLIFLTLKNSLLLCISLEIIFCFGLYISVTIINKIK